MQLPRPGKLNSPLIPGAWILPGGAALAPAYGAQATVFYAASCAILSTVLHAVGFAFTLFGLTVQG